MHKTGNIVITLKFWIIYTWILVNNAIYIYIRPWESVSLHWPFVPLWTKKNCFLNVIIITILLIGTLRECVVLCPVFQHSVDIELLDHAQFYVGTHQNNHVRCAPESTDAWRATPCSIAPTTRWRRFWGSCGRRMAYGGSMRYINYAVSSCYRFYSHNSVKINRINRVLNYDITRRTNIQDPRRKRSDEGAQIELGKTNCEACWWQVE